MEQPKIGAIKPLTFFKEVKIELTKVVWPTKNQVVKLTSIVICISLVVGIFIGGLDFLLTKITETILR